MDILLLITKFRQQKDIPFNSNKRYVFFVSIYTFQSFCTDSLYIWLRKNRNKQKYIRF